MYIGENSLGGPGPGILSRQAMKLALNEERVADVLNCINLLSQMGGPLNEARKAWHLATNDAVPTTQGGGGDVDRPSLTVGQAALHLVVEKPMTPLTVPHAWGLHRMRSLGAVPYLRLTKSSFWR